MDMSSLQSDNWSLSFQLQTIAASLTTPVQWWVWTTHSCALSRSSNRQNQRNRSSFMATTNNVLADTMIPSYVVGPSLVVSKQQTDIMTYDHRTRFAPHLMRPVFNVDLSACCCITPVLYLASFAEKHGLELRKRSSSLLLCMSSVPVSMHFWI